MATYQKRGKRIRAIIRRSDQPSASKTFPNKAQAQIWVRDVESRMDRGIWQDPTLLKEWSLTELIEDYEKKKDVAPNMRTSMNHFDRLLNNIKLNRLNSHVIADFVRSRAAEGAKPATIQLDLIALQNLLKYAKAHLKLPTSSDAITEARDLLKSSKLVGKSSERNRRPTQNELDLLKTYYGSPRVKAQSKTDMWALTQFAIYSSFRLGEICRIEWSDLDEVNRNIWIKKRKHPKEPRDDLVPLVGKAFEIIMEQPRVSSRIFPYNPRTISSTFPRHCHKLGIKDLRFHDFRHEGVSRLFEHGLQIQQVSVISGHTDWKTLKRYVQITPESIHAAFDRNS